jgi:hypothetical protein
MARSAAAGFAALDAMVKRIREIGLIPERVAPAIAIELDRELRRQIAAGEAPDGSKWPLTKKGEKPLQNAAAGLTVRALGSRIVARLTGPAVRHHLGIARGRIKRQVLPSTKLPERVIAAIRRVVEERFGG